MFTSNRHFGVPSTTLDTHGKAQNCGRSIMLEEKSDTKSQVESKVKRRKIFKYEFNGSRIQKIQNHG